MNHQDHINLIKKGVEYESGTWADLGSGEGAFTLALSDLLSETSQIISIDKNQTALAVQEKQFQELFPHRKIQFLQADFTQSLPIDTLNGIIMANSLHFIEEQKQIVILKKIRGYLKPKGKLVIIEYNTNDGNTWVPFPFRYEKLEKMTKKAGFQQSKLLAITPSKFLNEIYSAIMLNK